jgi:hypothetical protein
MNFSVEEFWEKKLIVNRDDLSLIVIEVSNLKSGFIQ